MGGYVCTVCVWSLTLYLPQGIILVYDITNQKSFDNIQKWLSNIEMVCRHSNPFLTILFLTMYS